MHVCEGVCNRLAHFHIHAVLHAHSELITLSFFIFLLFDHLAKDAKQPLRFRHFLDYTDGPICWWLSSSNIVVLCRLHSCKEPHHRVPIKTALHMRGYSHSPERKILRRPDYLRSD